ncbi:MAG TPA: hypothetical protein VGJ22_09135 [Anaerolineales bacterium]
MSAAENENNRQVLDYLRKRGKTEIPDAAPDSVRDPYHQLGSHPEIVERVWVQIGSQLPVDCRRLIFGTPALAQPASKVIFAFCLGMTYCLRLTRPLLEEALKLDLKTSTIWSGGGTTDAAKIFGPDWVFGAWKPQELQWCRQVYAAFDTPGNKP